MIEAEAERAGKRERSSSSSSSSSRRSSDLEKRFEIFHFLVMKSENTVRDTERERERHSQARMRSVIYVWSEAYVRLCPQPTPGNGFAPFRFLWTIVLLV